MSVKEIRIGYGMFEQSRRVYSCGFFNQEFQKWASTLGTWSGDFNYENHWRNQIKFADPNYKGN